MNVEHRWNFFLLIKNTSNICTFKHNLKSAVSTATITPLKKKRVREWQDGGFEKPFRGHRKDRESTIVKWQLQNILCQPRQRLHMAPEQAKRRFPASCYDTAGWTRGSHPYWPWRYGLAEFRWNVAWNVCARCIFIY